MKRTLFNISEDLLILAELLEETGGEVSDEQAEAAIDAFFAELGAERDAKLDGYCAVIKEFEAKKKARAEEAARLNALAAIDENNAKRLKGKLQQFFIAQGEKKIETARFKIALQANGGKLPVLLADWAQEHPEELPEQFRKVVFTPDLLAITEAIENGEELDFARLGERGSHIRIR